MKSYQVPHLSIKKWAEADRPREKLLKLGRKNLSDAELIAILLGSGSRQESALALAQRVLSHYKNDLNNLGKSSIHALCQFKGIGEAKAITLCAALELASRRQLSKQIIATITCSKDAYSSLLPHLAHLAHEEFWIILLNRANKIIGKEQISIGGVSGTVVDAKLVFQKAIQYLASSIILAHNHPSGNLRPSQADLGLTKKLKLAGQHLDIQVLDHLIITDNAYTSFADEQLM